MLRSTETAAITDAVLATILTPTTGVQYIHIQNNFLPVSWQYPRPRRSTSICHRHPAVVELVRCGEIQVVTLEI